MNNNEKEEPKERKEKKGQTTREVRKNEIKEERKKNRTIARRERIWRKKMQRQRQGMKN